MKKIASLVYGVAAYVAFLGAFLYLMAFTLNLAPHSVSGASSLPPLLAVLIDAGLIVLFGLQHSIMARPGFKEWWTRFVPRHLERSTFVLIAAVLVWGMTWFWQPIPGDLWNVTGTGMVVLYAISILGWLTVPVTSFFTDHFELFGLRQVFEYATGRSRRQPVFEERALYKKVRHPMMLAFLIAFWAAPQMTAGHALFAGLMTSYILAGIYFEERDLARAHGQVYRDYQERVPKLLPIGGLRGAPQSRIKAKAATAQSR